MSEGLTPKVASPPAETAHARHQRKKVESQAHHVLRVQWLSRPTPRYADGEPEAPSDVRQMLEASQRCLRGEAPSLLFCNCEPPSVMPEESSK